MKVWLTSDRLTINILIFLPAPFLKVLVRVGSNVPNFHEIRYISWELVHKLVHVLLFIFCKGVWPATPLPCSDKTNV